MFQDWPIDNSKAVELGIRDKLSDHEGETIRLLTIPELRNIRENDPYGILLDAFGKEYYAKDGMDEQTRYGFTAYGKILFGD